MATHDYVIDNQSAPSARSDINNVLQAIVTNNSNTSAPSVTYAGMWWLDTTNNYLKLRDKDNADWVIVGELDVTNDRWKLISDSIKAASAGGIDVLNSSGTKIIDLQVASQATAEAGTNNTELMTPLRTAQAIAENAVSYPQVITTLTSGTTYTIPSGAQAILIRASGGGGGGGHRRITNNSSGEGLPGANTTVTNATLGISITAKGGQGGITATGVVYGGFMDYLTGDTGGDVQRGKGAGGGSAYSDNYDTAAFAGRSANLVTKYVTGSSVGGQTLTYSIGAGGAGSAFGKQGETGYIEITVW